MYLRSEKTSFAGDDEKVCEKELIEFIGHKANLSGLKTENCMMIAFGVSRIMQYLIDDEDSCEEEHDDEEKENKDPCMMMFEIALHMDEHNVTLPSSLFIPMMEYCGYVIFDEKKKKGEKNFEKQEDEKSMYPYADMVKENVIKMLQQPKLSQARYHLETIRSELEHDKHAITAREMAIVMTAIITYRHQWINA